MRGHDAPSQEWDIYFDNKKICNCWDDSYGGELQVTNYDGQSIQNIWGAVDYESTYDKAWGWHTNLNLALEEVKSKTNFAKDVKKGVLIGFNKQNYDIIGYKSSILDMLAKNVGYKNEYVKIFTEETNYSPRSPYSATKAASDHLVNAWHHTYGLPTLITNCSNNYGPWQYPEKLIPVVILKALQGEDIPIYGKGLNIRDWLFVDDHIDAILKIIFQGKIGQNYCIGGNNPMSNIEIVKKICSILDKLNPKNFQHQDLIEFVKDRPGHDARYAINTNYIKKEINWQPKYNFDIAIHKTVLWYMENIDWCSEIMKRGSYQGGRLGSI